MTHVETPQSRCLCGAAEGDITPPVGIYHRMWGAATHDRSTGVHRPLIATVVCLQPDDYSQHDALPMALIGLDHCLFWPREMAELLERISAKTKLSQDRLFVAFSHTHGAGLMGYERAELPGGELIPGYLLDVANRVSSLIAEALTRLRPATIIYGLGRCDLARNRDYWDAQRGRFVCGFNPDSKADDTLLAVRVADSNNSTLATIVNYACHPTTLAFENTLISPDYIGALREVIQREYPAPCLFMQGASGDLGPREGFVGDPAVADRNGRQVGYAALSTLTALPPPGTRFEYSGPVESGATLGIWNDVPLSDDRLQTLAKWTSNTWTTHLAYRADLPKLADTERALAHWQAEFDAATSAQDATRARDARAMVERQTRLLTRLATLPAGETYPFPVTVWKWGDAVWVFVEGEHYNVLQTALRQRFPGVPLVVTTLVNGSRVFYVCPADSYGKGLYQESVAVLAAGSLELLIEDIDREIEATLEQKSGQGALGRP